MKIYIVSHYWDNGESYEDYRQYEEHFHFSTFDNADFFFHGKTHAFEGKWELSSKELDTQEAKILKHTSYQPCSSSLWNGEYWDDEPEDYCPEDVDNEIDALNKLTQLQS